MPIFYMIAVYLVGAALAKALLAHYDIDKREHKDMWLSWLTVFLFIIRGD